MFMVQKWQFLQLFFLGIFGQENVFYDIPERENAFLGNKNKNFKKSKNWHFFKGVNPWFWSKNDYFSNIFFFGNIGQENVFYDILERKNAFPGCKNKKFKKSKKWPFFQRGLTHGFGPKITIFPKFLFRQYNPGKCLLRYSRTKKRLFRL